jgi:hypothetical protein
MIEGWLCIEYPRINFPSLDSADFEKFQKRASRPYPLCFDAAFLFLVQPFARQVRFHTFKDIASKALSPGQMFRELNQGARTSKVASSWLPWNAGTWNESHHS